jgi:hypothetical protein
MQIAHNIQMRVQNSSSSMEGQVCPDCGFRPKPGEPGCAALRDALLARDFERPALFWPYHRMAVDAYCLQHPSYVASAKSLAAHLCGLCVALERANDAAQFRQLQLWLSTNPKIDKPDLPVFRGQITIGSVYAIDDPIQFGKGVDSWARAAWLAYRDLQPLARKWLEMSAQRHRRID